MTRSKIICVLGVVALVGCADDMANDDQPVATIIGVADAPFEGPCGTLQSLSILGDRTAAVLVQDGQILMMPATPEMIQCAGENGLEVTHTS